MNIEYFASSSTIEDEHSDDWERIKSVLRGIDLPHTCIIGAEDLASKIALVLELDGDRQDVLLYPKDKFLQLTKVELTRDIFERAQRPLGHKREIIQSAFNHFLKFREWPSSRQMSVDLRHLGDYYILAKEIGPNFIRTGEDHVEDAITTLTIYGVSLCSGAEEYLGTFLKVLKFLLNRYLKMPKSPVVSSEELVDEGIVRHGDENIIYEMVSTGFGLVSRSSKAKSGEFTLTASQSILSYEDVDTIEDYLRIAYYPRFWEQTEANVEPFSGRAIEIVGPEGIIVTESESSKQFDYDLFISYSSKDQKVADEIYEKLKEADLKPFLAPKDIDSGYIGSVTIREALISSAEMAILMSPNSIKSEWVLTEWGAAWGFEKHVTPILLDCQIGDIPKLLQDRQKRDYPNEIDRYIKEVLKRKHEP